MTQAIRDEATDHWDDRVVLEHVEGKAADARAAKGASSYAAEWRWATG